MAKGSKNLAAGSNPLEIIQDPRVLSAGGGALAAQLARKALISGGRGVFGTAVPTTNGIKYGAPGFTAMTDANKAVSGVSKEVPGALLNRVLLNAGMVVVGTLLIGASDDPNIEYLGLGFAASGAANVAGTLFSIDL